MNKLIKLGLFTIAAVLSFNAHATNVKNAIFSPNCSAEDIRSLAGEALVEISDKQDWGNGTSGYNVTLDTDKMTFSDLAKAMQNKGCFNA